MCWNSTGSPPSDGSKMPTPATRSMMSRRTVMAITGVPSSWMKLVAYSDHTNSGSRPHVIPGHRILWTVTMMFSPVMMELNPDMNTPIAPGTTFVCDDLELYGGYSVQPVSMPPASTAHAANPAPMMNTYQLAR